MNNIKYLSGLALALMLLFSSCSDKDHFSVAQMGSETLWENINNNENLSNFAAVLNATGYAAKLATSQMFTVFAPVNDNFTAAESQALIEQYNKEKAAGVKDEKNSVIKEFLQNHIALYNYTTSDENQVMALRMMNGKGSMYTSTSLSGVEYLTKDVLASNGVLYTMKTAIPYYQNIYEFIKTETGGDDGLDSLANFLYNYHFTEFVPEESTKGEIVDGKQQYLDSVTSVRNEILEDWIKARLDSEDSSYYAVLPTNKAWKEQYDVNKYFFKYVHNSQSPDTVVSSELRDSFEYILPRVNIIAGAQFSRTQNPKLGTGEVVDSVKSPLAVKYGRRKLVYGSFDKRVYEYMTPYEVQASVPSSGIFVDTDSTMCSNGVAFKANEWKIQRGNTFLQDISMEAEVATSIDSVYYKDLDPERFGRPVIIQRDVMLSSPFYNEVMNNKYCKFESSVNNMLGIVFNINNVLSNVWYDLYVVTVPSTASLYDVTDNLPTSIQATLYCKTKEGIEDTLEFKDNTQTTSKLGSVKIENYGSLSLDPDYKNTYTYTTDETTVNKLYIGRIKFDTSTYGLTDPMVKLRIETKVLQSKVVSGFKSKNLYIDRILLSPVIDKSISDIKNNL